ncbi:MAG: hypothetical protein ACKOXO_12920 [Cyanobium sp.]
MSSQPPSSDRLFNNADSFAQSFDQAWQLHARRHPNHGLSSEEKVALILEQISDHPFVASDPEQARQVAAFRVRLLGL